MTTNRKPDALPLSDEETVTDVDRRPTKNTDRVITPFREPRQQDYEHALRRRVASWPDNETAGFLTSQLKNFLDDRPNVTTENVTGMLFALALEGFKNAPGKRREVESLMEAVHVRDVETLLLRLGEFSRSRINGAKRACLKDPGNDALRLALEAARTPEVMMHLLGTNGTIPWDAQHDGHLVSRETSRTLGIVRWAKAETAERRERINEAMASVPAFGPRASRLWADRRPILAIDALSAYSAKLVGDLWTADPSIGVMLCPPLKRPGTNEQTVESNPFDAFEIPFLVDERAWLRALFSIDHFPVLLEPRVGGFTMTASIGMIDAREARKKGRWRPTPAPVWMRTLAEMGLLTRFDNVVADSERNGTPVHYRAWAERYHLVRDFPVVDSFVVKHASTFSPRVLEAIVRQRESFLRLRDSVTDTLDRYAMKEAAAEYVEREADSELENEGFDAPKSED